MQQPTGLLGFDLSHYQSGISFHDLAETGAKFVYAKATQGVGGMDPCYIDFRQRAAAVKLSFGAYAFFMPSVDPVAQARFFIDHAMPKSGELIPMLDVETDGPNIGHAALECAEEIKRLCGHWPLLYSGDCFYADHLRAVWPSEATVWLARYGAEPEHACGIWQWTDSFAVGGFKVDADVLRGGDAQLAAITMV